jgi:hypothetical protein
LDDPVSNSYIQSFHAPKPDPHLIVETFERSEEDNERLGLNDMDTKDDEYYGTIDDRNLRQRLTDPAKAKCGHLSVKAPSLSSDSTIYDQLVGFMAGHYRRWPRDVLHR